MGKIWEIIFEENYFIFMTEEFVLSEKLMRLGSRRQWVVHRGKVPFSPFAPYATAKSNAPETWGTFAEAQEALLMGNFDGLGFEFGNFPAGTLRVSGIDLDHVIREDGTLEPFAAVCSGNCRAYEQLHGILSFRDWASYPL